MINNVHYLAQKNQIINRICKISLRNKSFKRMPDKIRESKAEIHSHIQLANKQRTAKKERFTQRDLTNECST